MLDFAGGLVVHVVGGAVGLAGAAACGPRLGRFPQPGEGGPCAKELPGHNMSFVGLGTYFLFFGWLGFNCGSVYAYAATEYGFLIRRVAVCMTLSPCAAGLTALLLTSWRSGTIDLVHCVNGLLSGMVISSSVAGFVEPWAAVLGGALAGLVYYAVDRLLLRLRIDDPLAAAPIHLANGLAGTLLVGLLAKPQYVAQLTGSCTPSCGGLLYGMNGGLQLGQQALGALVVSAWSAAWAAGLFWLLARQGMLRVDQATELAGIDNIDHGGPAYPEFSGLGYGGSVRSGVNYQ